MHPAGAAAWSLALQKLEQSQLFCPSNMQKGEEGTCSKRECEHYRAGGGSGGTDLVRQEKVLSRSYFEATHPHRRLRFSHIMLRTTHYLSLARQEARNEKNHCLTLAASCHQD